jgi:diguanylate cyclase (GGDEF)-like protein
MLLRAKRDALASWCGVHPADLAELSPEVVDALSAQVAREARERGEIDALRADAARWEQLARTDGLTGLANRRALEERLDAEIARSRRGGHPLAVLIADLDGLKAINDGHGHNAGDAVLRAIGGRLQHAVRRSDVAGRWGGDEFLVICPETGAEAAQLVADKLLEVVVSSPVAVARQRLSVGLSIGWAVLADGDDGAALIASADASLYAVKALRGGVATPRSTPD